MSAPFLSKGDNLHRARLSSALFLFLAAFLPAVLPFVRRAAPVFLVFAALLIVIHIVRHGIWREVSARLAPFPVLVGTSFLIWAALTCLWAPVAMRSWQSVGSGVLIFISGLCLFIIPSERSRRADVFSVLAISFAALVVLIDLKTGGALLHFIHSRPEPYRYNMVLVSLVALSFGLFHQGPTLAQPLKYVAVLLLTGAVFVGESETAKLALLIGYFVLFLSPVVSRIVSYFCFLVGVAAAWIVFLLAPEFLSDLAKVWPSMAEMGHAAERVQIWIAYSKFSLAGLPWGWGVESVAHVPMTSYYAIVPDNLKSSLEWLHPHNNFIQIVAELGFPGIFLGMVGSFYFVVWSHADERLRPARAGLLAAIMVVTLVSHGFWQMWWWSVVLIAFVMLSHSGIARAQN